MKMCKVLSCSFKSPFQNSLRSILPKTVIELFSFGRPNETRKCPRVLDDHCRCVRFRFKAARATSSRAIFHLKTFELHELWAHSQHQLLILFRMPRFALRIHPYHANAQNASCPCSACASPFSRVNLNKTSITCRGSAHMTRLLTKNFCCCLLFKSWMRCFSHRAKRETSLILVTHDHILSSFVWHDCSLMIVPVTAHLPKFLW